MNPYRLVVVTHIMFLCAVTSNAQKLISIEDRDEILEHNAGVAQHLEDALAYNWRIPGHGLIRAGFYKTSLSNSWSLQINDPTVTSLTTPKEKEWTANQSLLKKREFLKLADESLKHFKKARPNAEITNISFDLHLIDSLWSEVLTTLQAKMMNMKGPSSSKSDSLRKTLINELESSEIIKEFSELLSHHNIQSDSVGLGLESVTLQPAAIGTPWNELAKRPGLGIWLPNSCSISVKSIPVNQP